MQADDRREKGLAGGRLNSIGFESMQKKAQVAEQNHDAAHLSNQTDAVPESSFLPQPDQVSLARRLRHGERAAAEELVDAYYARIFLLMRSLGYDRQTSEDLTQETFMRAWAHIGQLRDGKALTGWLFRIAGNIAKLQWRRQKRMEPTVADVGESPADGATQAGTRERSARLREAVSHLPVKLRQAIVLHYMNELTISEAAEAAGIRPGTLKSRLNRALEALREQVEDW
jgi:RNA polymerase sigma factor (sigma-70 family)